MQNAQDEVFFSFLAEWYDPLPQLTKQYLLKYFQKSNEVEMVDLKSRRLFLKRSPCPGHMSLRDFQIDSKVLLYGRDLTIAGFGDDRTKASFEARAALSLVLVAPDAVPHVGRILDHLEAGPTALALRGLRMFALDMNEASDVAQILKLEGAQAGKLAEQLAGGNMVAAALVGEDAITAVLAMESEMVKRYGQGLWFARDEEQVTKLQDFLFQQPHAPTATLDNCTCCIIKPHAVKEKNTGAIVQHIMDAGYQVSALQMLQFDRVTATEFMEVYRGVTPVYAESIEQLTTGQSVALELRAENAVSTFRQTAGPWDVDMAKELRPDTLRGKFGVNSVRSAIHCTDLPEDGARECEYVFDLMAGDTAT